MKIGPNEKIMDPIDYLDHQIEIKLGGDSSRIEELFFNEEVLSELILRGQNSDWYHYEIKTYDGWYLVKSDGKYQAYFQERGGKYYARQFNKLNEAASYFYEQSRYFHT